jgi:hypothetical protein
MDDFTSIKFDNFSLKNNSKSPLKPDIFSSRNNDKITSSEKTKYFKLRVNSNVDEKKLLYNHPPKSTTNREGNFLQTTNNLHFTRKYLNK